MKIFSHRGNITGPTKTTENTPKQVKKALQLGFSLETDIRRNKDGVFYVNHDLGVISPSSLATNHTSVWRQFPDNTVALNIKELGYEWELLSFLQQEDVVDQVFLFDMEILEVDKGATAKLFRKFNSKIKLAARLSDRKESLNQALTILEAEIIWLDEFDSYWVTDDLVYHLKDQKKTIYAISPELHQFPKQERLRRWKDFISWKVDGICTDFPCELRRCLNDLFMES